jgi:hypothetical protein
MRGMPLVSPLRHLTSPQHNHPRKVIPSVCFHFPRDTLKELYWGRPQLWTRQRAIRSPSPRQVRPRQIPHRR